MDLQGDFQNAGAEKVRRWHRFGLAFFVYVTAPVYHHEQHAVRQISRNIELMRYHYYGDDLLLLLLQLVSASSAATTGSAGLASTSIASAEPNLTDLGVTKASYAKQEIGHRLAQAAQPIKDPDRSAEGRPPGSGR